MKNLLFVAFGGAIGSIARYSLSLFINHNYNFYSLPIGTISVNIIGCMIIGILSGYLNSREILSEHWNLFIFIGLLGGFTTFSSFGLETVKLIQEGLFLTAFLNVSISLIFGLLAVWLGWLIFQK